MLVGACYTLFRMRKNLVIGIKRGVQDVQKSAAAAQSTQRTERDLSFKTVLIGIAAVFILMIGLYFYFTGVLGGAFLAALVMLVTGFFFAAVSGNLVGLIGSSNNPISGLTLATTIVAALTMVIIGVKGAQGVAAVLGVAAVVCVSSAVAGEMLQDLKVGHILGGTPWKMQIGDLIGVVVAGAVMFFPLYILHVSDLEGEPAHRRIRRQESPRAAGGAHGGALAGDRRRRDGLAARRRRDRDGDLAHPDPACKSPMLFAVGMYLPLETTFAIFIGGLIRGAVERAAARRGYNAAQKARVENAGVLVASGFIAGEALMGLGVAAVVFFAGKFPEIVAFAGIAGWLAIPVFAILALYLIYVPLSKAGAADEPAPPTAVM